MRRRKEEESVEFTPVDKEVGPETQLEIGRELLPPTRAAGMSAEYLLGNYPPELINIAFWEMVAEGAHQEVIRIAKEFILPSKLQLGRSIRDTAQEERVRLWAVQIGALIGMSEEEAVAYANEQIEETVRAQQEELTRITRAQRRRRGLSPGTATA
mgnify:CR=1 FL=1